jgi:AhpD family alkylhydroperoxidase
MQRVFSIVVASLVLLAGGPAFHAAQGELTTVDALMRQARARVNGAARVALAPDTPEAARTADRFEQAGGRTPNYVRVLSARIPNAGRAFEAAFRSMLLDGAIEPEVKMALGLRVAQVNASPYVAAHLSRLLDGTERGRQLLTQLKTGSLDRMKPADRLAVHYGEALSRDVHGIGEEDFRTIRGYYNDGQIVELTLVDSFFNYFTRMVEALNLPVESWALDTKFTPPADAAFAPVRERVNLISDEQLTWAKSVGNGAGRGNAPAPAGAFTLVNSQRAMMLSPVITTAWRGYTGALGTGAVVDRETLLQVSFAVSMANGCRYCTLHQVQGLRRLGVSIDKLVAMRKDDSALTPKELVAVEFARKSTRSPSSITEADYDRLVKTFGDRGALDVLLQTCNFAFMNRFTDNLGLPSEDEAVKTYREVYGADFQPIKSSAR